MSVRFLLAGISAALLGATSTRAQQPAPAPLRVDSIFTRSVDGIVDSVTLTIFAHAAAGSCRHVEMHIVPDAQKTRVSGAASEMPSDGKCAAATDTAYVLGQHIAKSIPNYYDPGFYIEYVQPDNSVLRITEPQRAHVVRARP